jgi:hypothetical protein
MTMRGRRRHKSRYRGATVRGAHAGSSRAPTYSHGGAGLGVRGLERGLYGQRHVCRDDECCSDGHRDLRNLSADTGGGPVNGPRVNCVRPASTPNDCTGALRGPGRWSRSRPRRPGLRPSRLEWRLFRQRPVDDEDAVSRAVPSPTSLLVLAEPLEPIRRQLGIPDRVLDVPVSQVVLDRARVGELVLDGASPAEPLLPGLHCPPRRPGPDYLRATSSTAGATSRSRRVKVGPRQTGVPLDHGQDGPAAGLLDR